MAKPPDAPQESAELVLFDLDNTLFDRAATFRTWIGEFVRGRGLPPAEVEWFVAADEDGYAPRRRMWAKAKERYGFDESAEDLRATYRASYLDFCQPDAEVHEGLVDLRQGGWRIGIVTNGSMPQQSHKAARLGLLPLVDGFCASNFFA